MIEQRWKVLLLLALGESWRCLLSLIIIVAALKHGVGAKVLLARGTKQACEQTDRNMTSFMHAVHPNVVKQNYVTYLLLA